MKTTTSYDTKCWGKIHAWAHPKQGHSKAEWNKWIQKEEILFGQTRFIIYRWTHQFVESYLKETGNDYSKDFPMIWMWNCQAILVNIGKGEIKKEIEAHCCQWCKNIRQSGQCFTWNYKILVGWLVGCILWHINPCCLFYAKSCLHI